MYKQSMQNISKTMSLLLLGIITLLVVAKPVYAEDATENIVGFSYKLSYSDNQINGENGYFDLELAPGKEETVIINLSNSGKEKININLSINGTKTNSNGILEYGPTDIENDNSLKFPFEKLVRAPETVELKAGESKDVPVKVKMPETSFDGMILGGIQMKKAEAEEEKPSQGATVRNTYSYIVAMRLQNKTAEVKPEIEFNKATGSQRNYRNSVAINLSNITGSLVKSKLDIESQISKKGSNEVLYERKQTGMSIAPNSQMDFYVSMAGEQMVAGDYTARVLASIDDQTWEKSLDFTITKEEADKYNKRDVGLVQDRGLDVKLVAMIVIGFLVLVIIIFIVVRLMKKKKKAQSRRSTNKSKTKKRNK